MSVRDDGPEFVKCIVQIVHSSALSGVDVQSHAFPLSSRLGFRRAVQSGRSWSGNDAELSSTLINSVLLREVWPLRGHKAVRF